MPPQHLHLVPSNYAHYRDAHPPRSKADPEKSATVSGLELGGAWSLVALGMVFGALFSGYWREVVALLVLGLVSVAGGYAIYRTDRRAK
jgi:hypothetical protein